MLASCVAISLIALAVVCTRPNQVAAQPGGAPLTDDPTTDVSEPVGTTGADTPQSSVANHVRVHPVRSEYQSGETRIRVLLPDRIEPGQQYPVLYVLPVESGESTRWGNSIAEVRRHDLHNKYGLICVFPTFSDLPWYANHPTDARIAQEKYFVEAVVPFVERTYPVIADQRGRLLVGFSKSGWGAWSLLLRHPNLFGRAAAWDAPLMQDKPDRYGMQPIFGTQANFEQYRISTLLKQQTDLVSGSNRLILLGYGNFRAHHQQAHALMQRLSIPHAYRDGPKRKHAWDGGWLPEAVEKLASHSDSDLTEPLPTRRKRRAEACE